MENILEKDVLKYFQDFPEGAYRVIYQTKWSSSGIFRLLPSLCQSLLLRLVFLSSTIDLPTVEKQFTITKQEIIHVLSLLESVKIIKKVMINGKTQFQMNADFQTHLKESILGPMVPNYVVSDCNFSVKDALIKKASLNNAVKMFEDFLMKLLTFNESHNLPKSAFELFKDLELVNDAGSQITRKGYQFLFQETKTQIWILMLSIFGPAQRKRRMGKLINEFFELTYLAPETCYNADPFTKIYSAAPLILFDMMGIIAYSKEKNALVVTPLMSLLRSNALVPSDLVTKPRTITETNYTVYIYTESFFQVKLYSLFIRQNLQLTNLCVGRITYDTVTEAFLKGITNEMLVNFLQPNLPKNIQAQIDLWKRELNRLKEVRAVKFRFYEPELEVQKELYHLTKSEAEKMKGVVFYKEEELTLFVRYDVAEKIKEFLRRKTREESFIARLRKSESDEKKESRSFSSFPQRGISRQEPSKSISRSESKSFKDQRSISRPDTKRPPISNPGVNKRLPEPTQIKSVPTKKSYVLSDSDD
ncbi:TFIIH basal transcription factor complex p52 subunit, putative [Entamoeba invadens IP1]|uniref:General transcription factor IIH subunit 4 n=1 Tax=Entamoeba invadens IP1 TaxID=370355 RepID=A0A0A1U347_ENTIV|nr:TFIIH basal transcription factor complex p52 subunit, putative [Entamoeba invadens IP1]ELP88449.1 TFIIH basal transcription factor complex p52 subunit, putative [Entamoeba invadens IP1]|eukprot:XP_004255220.1 TFIIH basal transcription factor complex p52 subunit, putative [Entamoeba invadens IP1]